MSEKKKYRVKDTNKDKVIAEDKDLENLIQTVFKKGKRAANASRGFCLTSPTRSHQLKLEVGTPEPNYDWEEYTGGEQ